MLFEVLVWVVDCEVYVNLEFKWEFFLFDDWVVCMFDSIWVYGLSCCVIVSSFNLLLLWVVCEFVLEVECGLLYYWFYCFGFLNLLEVVGCWVDCVVLYLQY